MLWFIISLKTALLLQSLLTMNIPAEFNHKGSFIMANTLKSKEIFNLTRPTWLDKARMSKGINHDRQHLGIILDANKTIRIRQTNPHFTKKLTLRLLNVDSRTEDSALVGADWTELSVGAVSVPFVDTPYAEMGATVEYEYDNGAKKLPVYQQGGSQDAFFNEWDSQNAEFALVESEYAILLSPEISKVAFKNLWLTGGIDSLIDYYYSIFDFYNNLAGLSFDASQFTDLNCPNRYFMKADAESEYGAYYSNYWTAEASSSISSYWVEPDPTNWGSLHEIAHGYDPFYGRDLYFSVAEVWNNIYAASYQSLMLGERQYQEGWLYDYGNQAGVEQVINDNIDSGIPLNAWELRSKLYFLMLMFQASDIVAFTYFNQQYRLKCNTAGFTFTDYYLLDNIADSLASSGNKVDVAPFVLLAGGYITPVQRELNKFSRAVTVYPLNRLVEGSDLEALRRQLDLQTTFNLVSTEQLAVSGLTGNIVLTLEINDFRQIEGETLLLLNGGQNIRRLVIESSQINLTDLPVGVYTLHLPSGKNKKYQLDNDYLVVNQWDTRQTVNYNQKLASPLASQSFIMNGVDEDLFGRILVDQCNQTFTVDIVNPEPHYRYENELYASVSLKDPQGYETFYLEIFGTNVELSHDELPFSVGSTLEIFHAETKTRLKLSPDFDGIIDTTSTVNTFEITGLGVKNIVLGNDPLDGLLAQIALAAEKLRANYEMLHAECHAKDDIWLAIQSVPQPLRDELLVQYADCLPGNNEGPQPSATLQNPSAETGDLTGWTLDKGQFRVITEQDGIRAPDGKYFFTARAGGEFADEVDQMSQQIMLDGTLVSQGNAVANLTFKSNGWGDGDAGEVHLVAKNRAGNELARAQVSSIHEMRYWADNEISLDLPPNAATLSVEVKAIRNSGEVSDVHFDAFVLTVDAT